MTNSNRAIKQLYKSVKYASFRNASTEMDLIFKTLKGIFAYFWCSVTHRLHLYVGF